MAIQTLQLPDPWVALGVACHFVSRHKPFGDFTAGELVRTLDAQVRQKHYLFAMDMDAKPPKVVGYFGWALYDHLGGEEFQRTGHAPREELASGGEVLWIMTATADSRRAFFDLVKATRALHPDHRVMAVRNKPGGKRVAIDQSRERVREKANANGQGAA